MSRKLVVRRPSHSRSQPEGSGRSSRLVIAGSMALAGLLAAGCSADISRFDGQGFGLTDSKSATIPPTGMRKGEAANLGNAVPDGGTTSPGGAYYPPTSNRTGNAGGSVRMSSLPEPVGPSSPPAAMPQQRNASIAPRPAAHAATQAKPIVAGATIEVVQGDTLFGLAKKHAVPVNELMSVNNLTAPNIKPGQKLVLPASRSISRTATPHKPIQRAEPVRVAAIPQQNAGPSQPVSPIPVATPAPTNWTGSHTVKPGENLYGIARANRTSLAQLQQVNGIVDATKVKPGTVLKVPGGAVTASAAPDVALAPPATKVAGASTTAETPRVTQMATRPVIINSAPVAPQQVAAIDPVEPPTDGAPAVESKASAKKGTDVASAGGAAVTGQKFRWPVKGRVIASYGSRTDQTHNDGINIAVPMGTDVHAAEQGVVAYAGSELKGYGNLILLRHDNGWVTAYAHNEEILVKRGDKVKRGQAIAKAGKTGTVDQPQVHFEIRQGQKPVDPMPHMEKL